MSIINLVQISFHEHSKKEISLRGPQDAVTDFGDPFQREVDDLIDTFWSHNIAVGLAAPQIGIAKRLAVINHNRDRDSDTLVLVNPEIIEYSGKKDVKRESCMSVPDYVGDVERRKRVVVRFCDRFGQQKELAADGFLARVIQHEVDHLDGILYLDRMKTLANLKKTDIFTKD